jgi:hypothetical protein
MQIYDPSKPKSLGRWILVKHQHPYFPNQTTSEWQYQAGLNDPLASQYEEIKNA